MADTPGTTAPDSSGVIPMGHTADGRSAVLNLATGAIELRGNENPGHRLLQQCDIDTARVSSIFHGAGYVVHVRNGGYVVVEDHEIPTLVDVPRGLPMVRMRRYFDFREQVDQAARYRCANTINEALNTGRAYCDDDGDLVIEAELHLGAGLSCAQLLAGYRFYHNAVEDVIALEDVEDLLDL